jgi:hypothetical protein
MSEPFVYDKAKYHYEGDFPDDLEAAQGFVHTGMFLGWIIERNFYSTEWFGPELASYVIAVKNRELSGPKFFEACDGVFLDTMLNVEGNAFAHHYFEFGRGKYLRDYAEVLVVPNGLSTIYHVADSWQNYDRIKRRISKRYRQWKWPYTGWLRSLLGIG